MNPRVQPLQPIQLTPAAALQPPQQVVVAPTSAAPREDASRVRSVWTGPYEVKLERLRLEAEKERRRLEQLQQRTPLETTSSKDPLEPGNELIAYLNGLREYLVRCF